MVVRAILKKIVPSIIKGIAGIFHKSGYEIHRCKIKNDTNWNVKDWNSTIHHRSFDACSNEQQLDKILLQQLSPSDYKVLVFEDCFDFHL